MTFLNSLPLMALAALSSIRLEDMRQFRLNQGGFDTIDMACEKIVDGDLIEEYIRSKFGHWLCGFENSSALQSVRQFLRYAGIDELR